MTTDMTPDAAALLTRFCRELLAGDDDDRKNLLATAAAHQGDPAWTAENPDQWAHVTSRGVLTMVVLWYGQLGVDRLTPSDGDEIDSDSTTLADLDDTDLTPAEVAEVQRIIRVTPLND